MRTTGIDQMIKWPMVSHFYQDKQRTQERRQIQKQSLFDRWVTIN